MLRDPGARSHHDENDSHVVLANQCASRMPRALVGILAPHFGIDGRQIEDDSSMDGLCLVTRMSSPFRSTAVPKNSWSSLYRL